MGTEVNEYRLIILLCLQKQVEVRGRVSPPAPKTNIPSIYPLASIVQAAPTTPPHKKNSSSGSSSSNSSRFHHPPQNPTQLLQLLLLFYRWRPTEKLINPISLPAPCRGSRGSCVPKAGAFSGKPRRPRWWYWCRWCCWCCCWLLLLVVVVGGARSPPY